MEALWKQLAPIPNLNIEKSELTNTGQGAVSIFSAFASMQCLPKVACNLDSTALPMSVWDYKQMFLAISRGVCKSTVDAMAARTTDNVASAQVSQKVNSNSTRPTSS